ncbi:MAG: GNAT family N-acetyltransferase [Armatimonadetes bacterium]|nr:GNAT family N-acetyltransferase [Armatimonadota bacterium]
MTTTLTIRLATRADEPGIQHVIRTVYEEYGWPWDPEDYHKDLYDIQTYYFDHGGHFWVAELDGKVVGTAALEVFSAFPNGDATVMVDGFVRGAGCDCSIERLYVLAETRGKGVGSGLWRTVIDAAKARGCRRMEIWSDKRLEEAHRLYEKTGAQRIGDRLCHDPDQSPEWGMVLNL